MGATEWPRAGRNRAAHALSRRTAWMALASVAAALGVFLAILGLPAPAAPGPGVCPAAWQSAPPTATPIKHLFVIVKENHAFENYFGALPGVLGNPPNGTFPTSFTGNSTVQPFPIDASSTSDLPHDAASGLVDYNGGANNLFVAQAAALGYGSALDAVGYYTAAQLPAYYQYAQAYGLGDRFFSGVLGPTFPNRVFDLSAYTGSWNSDTPPPSNVTDHPTVLDQLTAAAVPWNYDYSGLPLALAALAPKWFPSLWTHSCNAGRIANVSTLASQLAGPVPPAVVYLDPSNDLTYSEHPPENVTLGEAWTVAAVNTIFSSPVANSSAVLIFFDENGGFWDPIPPPLTSTGRDGFRVPFLVLSPWTPAGTVCSSTLDPASVLAFIDTNWGQPYLSPRVASAGNLSCFFDFHAPPRAPLILPTPISLVAADMPSAPVKSSPGA